MGRLLNLLCIDYDLAKIQGGSKTMQYLVSVKL